MLRNRVHAAAITVAALGTFSVAFLIASEVTSQEPRDREAGFSEQDQLTAHAGGVPTSIARTKERNTALLSSGITPNDVEFVYIEPQGHFFKEYESIDQLVVATRVHTIVRGRVESLRFGSASADNYELAVIATFVVTGVLKGGPHQPEIEVVFPVALQPSSDGGRPRVSVSIYFPVPPPGADSLMLLEEPTDTGRYEPVLSGTYLVALDNTLTPINGARDLFNAAGTRVGQLEEQLMRDVP